MSRLRVLVVEDDFILNQTLSEHLHECGFSVESVYCGAAAFEAISRGRPLDALVSDIDLGPGVDGIAVAHCARDSYPRLPVVFVSATGAAICASSGVAEFRFIAKPFHPRAVAQALGHAIERPAT